MRVLVINTGSSSIKYQLFDMNREEVLASGLAEKIGEATSTLRHGKVSPTGEYQETIQRQRITNHNEGLLRIAELLTHREYGVIESSALITAVGHRVVHGGETFQAPTVINDTVISAIKENIPLAPLHNPANLTGIKVAQSVFPEALHVAVFDTAFHQTIPEHAFLYAVPLELYEKHHVRRYGFHGTSHAFVAEQAARQVGRSFNSLNIITIHLGNGASIAAIQRGKCVDTTMGMTPLEGLVMGTRSGDIDPALPFFLANHLNMSLKEIDMLLNNESGLKGLCGTNDMRELLKKKEGGDPRASIALQVYTYRIKKYIGAYCAALGTVDLLVFTAGIGENSPQVRSDSCTGLENLGIIIDAEKNNKAEPGTREISSSQSEITVLVVPTNEELEIARETETLARELS